MMPKRTRYPKQRFLDSETGTIHKRWQNRIKVALVYPNRYHVGMSNLGFQTVYRLFNEHDNVVCERAFLPEPGQKKTRQLLTIESARPLANFDIIAFSFSFETDAPGILAVLDKAGLPLPASERGDTLPLVMAGGVACFLNPEPISLFIDCFLMGEAERLVPSFLNHFDPFLKKSETLKHLATQVPGVYVPAFYKPSYHKDGTLSSFDPITDVPETIRRVYAKDLSDTPTSSVILTPDTTFDNTYLIEVSRGCPHGCRFCSAGYIYRPPRFRPLSLLEQQMKSGASLTDKIGLVGAAVSDLPDLKALCAGSRGKDIRISFSSFRANALEDELVRTLQQSRVKTATIGPDAGSEKMLKVINKGITREDVLSAARILVEAGIPNLKVYFMVGLPQETMDDVHQIVDLCKRLKEQFLESSRAKKRIGEITVSLNSFVPKPFTPFQWAAMDDVKTLQKKIRIIKDGLRKTTNIHVNADVPRHARVQALISRGDRKVSALIAASVKNRGNWPQTLKAAEIDPDFYVGRQRPDDELFPWDFIDHGIDKRFLLKEYKRAQKGKSSSPCPGTPDTCQICGVCKDKDDSGGCDVPGK